METCPDCEYVEKQVVGNPNFKVIDIGKHVRRSSFARLLPKGRKNLKEFIKLRDTHPAFVEAKVVDDLGIPCYVLEDGTVTLYSCHSSTLPAIFTMYTALKILHMQNLLKNHI